jgi:uncharacterized membrane protein HdeD (DUF308 family)
MLVGVFVLVRALMCSVWTVCMGGRRLLCEGLVEVVGDTAVS